MKVFFGISNNDYPSYKCWVSYDGSIHIDNNHHDYIFQTRHDHFILCNQIFDIHKYEFYNNKITKNNDFYFLLHRINLLPKKLLTKYLLKYDCYTDYKI